MSRAIGPPDHLDPGSTKYWHIMKSEMYILVCTPDKKYTDLRRQLETAGKTSQTTIVSMIAAAMAVHVGMIAGVLVPFCALLLVAVAKVGIECIL